METEFARVMGADLTAFDGIKFNRDRQQASLAADRAKERDIVERLTAAQQENSPGKQSPSPR